MKKIILMLILGISAFASTFVKDDKEYTISEKEYVVVCLEGHKWMQFIQQGSGKGSQYYVNDGNPQQMFERTYSNYGPINVPIKCVSEK